MLACSSAKVPASFRLPLAGWYVEPGIAGGGVYGEIDADYTSDSGAQIAGADESISWVYRPYLRVGRVNDWVLFGVEAGYEQTGLDFDVGPGEDYANWYVGASVGPTWLSISSLRRTMTWGYMARLRQAEIGQSEKTREGGYDKQVKHHREDTHGGVSPRCELI